MAGYVDGFVIPIPRAHLAAYKAMAKKAGKIWREHGCVEYWECVGDDLATKHGIPFPKLARVKRGETVLFSWIRYRNKAHRDRVNAKVMADPRIAAMMTAETPFDLKRMSYGGFQSIVEA
jgi:uncharacterized protein YbaA (DUF1428 family)